jgi:DNA replication protein DnaC
MSQAQSRNEDLNRYLKELHLPAVRSCFEEKARQAERETLGYEQYLLELMERECQERREHRITRLLRDSRLPLEKRMENFDLKRLPAKAARQVKSLLDGGFLDRRENVLAFGNPGSGKTHLLSALDQELIRQGAASRSARVCAWCRIYCAPRMNSA